MLLCFDGEEGWGGVWSVDMIHKTNDDGYRFMNYGIMNEMNYEIMNEMNYEIMNEMNYEL